MTSTFKRKGSPIKITLGRYIFHADMFIDKIVVRSNKTNKKTTLHFDAIRDDQGFRLNLPTETYVGQKPSVCYYELDEVICRNILNKIVYKHICTDEQRRHIDTSTRRQKRRLAKKYVGRMFEFCDPNDLLNKFGIILSFAGDLNHSQMLQVYDEIEQFSRFSSGYRYAENIDDYNIMMHNEHVLKNEKITDDMTCVSLDAPGMPSRIALCLVNNIRHYAFIDDVKLKFL